MASHDPAIEPTADSQAAQAPVGRRDGALLIIVFTALLVLPPVGHHLIVKSDEARFALLARDMLERGAWFSAAVEGQQYRNKPPLFPWTIAVLSRARGAVTEGTAQLPAAVAAIAAAWCTFLLGDRLFGRRAGVWAALILATSASFFIHSQLILPDMLVLAFATACYYAFWRAMHEPGNTRALVGFYAALAFAIFAKGPVGLLPLLVVAIWLVAHHGVRGVARLWSVAGIAVFCVVTLAWLGPFLASGSQSFGENVVWEDWLAWYLAWPAPRRILAFLGDAFVGFLPWTLVLILAIGPALRARRDPAMSLGAPVARRSPARDHPVESAAGALSAPDLSGGGAPRRVVGGYARRERRRPWDACSDGPRSSPRWRRSRSCRSFSTIEGIGLPPDPALTRKVLPTLAGGIVLGMHLPDRAQERPAHAARHGWRPRDGRPARVRRVGRQRLDRNDRGLQDAGCQPSTPGAQRRPAGLHRGQAPAARFLFRTRAAAGS